MKDPREVKTIHVLGAGGVGFYVATLLRVEVPGVQMCVWDPDTFEGGTGHQRLPATASPSQTKVSLLRSHIAFVWGLEPPATKEELFTGVPPEGRGKGWLLDALVVDCTDMGNRARAKMWKEAEKHGAQMIRASYDGNGVTVVAWGLPFGDTDHAGYEMQPSLAQSFRAGGLAAEFVGRYLQGEVIDELVVRVGKDANREES